MKSALVCVLFVVACGSSANGGAPGAESTDGGSPAPIPTTEPTADAGPELTPPASGVQLHTTPYVLAPGDETVVCQVLSSSHPTMNLSAYEVSERVSMHHLTLYYGPPNVVDPCNGELQPIFLAQAKRARTDLSGGAPEYAGATLEIPAGTFVAKIHAINTTTEPATIEAWINLETLATATLPLAALSLSAGQTTLAVPPHTAQTFKASATAPADVTILQLVGHTHSHTTEERASYGGKTIYTDDTWEEPTPAWFTSRTAPLVIKKGTVISWGCDINNTSDATLRYAERAITAEMCNLTGFVRGPVGWAASSP